MVTYISDAAASTNSTSGTWGTWTATTGSSTTVDVWVEWTASSGTTTNNIPATIYREPTQQEFEAQAARERERVRADAERQRLAHEADLRADRLLLSLLNRRQRKEFRESNRISIYKPGRHHPDWILHKQRSYNVTELDRLGNPIRKHCVQTVGVPLSDQLATQLLYLRNNPAALLHVANHQELTSRN